MASVPRSDYVSPSAYLALEREADTKHEYVAGQIVAMAGASREHNLIVLNIASEVRAQLRGRPCETYPSDMRVRVPSRQLYSYPDVTVVCGEPQFEDSQVDTLLNPTLLVEVLSPSTERYDRGTKFRAYRTIPALRELLFVSQEGPLVERYRRGADGQWLLSEAAGLEAEIALESIGCTLALRDIYERVTFPPPDHEREADETPRRDE